VKPLNTVLLFNVALICGILASQITNLEPFRIKLLFLADTLLAYIMMQVGLKFLIQKKKWKSYLVDYGVASLAAGLPWIFCFLYFLMFGAGSWEENLLLARFAAPTATGVLFAMLISAGLGMTWLFRKVEVLVILDDLDTILFLVPLQFLLSGGESGLIFIACVMVVLVIVGWRYMHKLRLPRGRPWLLCYALAISGIAEWVEMSYGLEVEVLLPSFILGLLLYTPRAQSNEHVHSRPERKGAAMADKSIKLFFMVLVGLLLPQITLNAQTWKDLALHVICITLLMNIGKLAPIFFYKKEASFRERAAIAISMMPRGEMGAGILAIALGHGIKHLMAQVAALSLALNLLLTGLFIWIVMWLLKGKKLASH
jgi:Kef-type K+ transport system membrane component KefB